MPFEERIAAVNSNRAGEYKICEERSICALLSNLATFLGSMYHLHICLLSNPGKDRREHPGDATCQTAEQDMRAVSFFRLILRGLCKKAEGAED
jgi:hypothetical protein